MRDPIRDINSKEGVVCVLDNTRLKTKVLIKSQVEIFNVCRVVGSRMAAMMLLLLSYSVLPVPLARLLCGAEDAELDGGKIDRGEIESGRAEFSAIPPPIGGEEVAVAG